MRWVAADERTESAGGRDPCPSPHGFHVARSGDLAPLSWAGGAKAPHCPHLCCHALLVFLRTAWLLLFHSVLGVPSPAHVQVLGDQTCPP